MGLFDKKPKKAVYGRSKEEADDLRGKFFNNISGQSWNKAKSIKIKSKKPSAVQAARARRRKRI